MQRQTRSLEALCEGGRSPGSDITQEGQVGPRVSVRDCKVPQVRQAKVNYFHLILFYAFGCQAAPGTQALQSFLDPFVMTLLQEGRNHNMKICGAFRFKCPAGQTIPRCMRQFWQKQDLSLRKNGFGNEVDQTTWCLVQNPHKRVPQVDASFETKQTMEMCTSEFPTSFRCEVYFFAVCFFFIVVYDYGAVANFWFHDISNRRWDESATRKTSKWSRR